jgi:hypothetical protein
MANLTSVLPTLTAMGIVALRQQVVMPRLVNRDYQPLFGAGRGATINVAIPSAIEAVAVTPAATPPATAAIAPTAVPVTLDQWFEAPFELSDKDLTQVDRGILPMQASEAIKALANKIDSFLFGMYKKFYGYAGTAGTTPFGTDLSAYLEARKVLNNQLAPLEPRFCVINPDAEANALGLRAFQDASFAGTAEVIVNGQIGRKLGALWAMSQNVPTHTKGAAGTILVDNAAGYAAGTTVIHMDGATSKPAVGDILSFAGHTQTYTVVSATDIVAPSDTDVTISPPLVAAVVDNEAVTFRNSHVVNLLFHRDAIAFATAPLQDANIAPGLVATESIVDPMSGLALRLELTREHKRWRWSYDVLYGGAVPRPELGVRIAG